MRAAPLTLRPPTEPVHYEAVACWESYTGPDAYQTSTITKQISLRGQPLAEGRVALTFDTSPPVLTKPRDLESLETMALRLAALYERVVVEAAPTGQFAALLNHAALLQTWERLAQSLRDSTTAEDRITPTLLPGQTGMGPGQCTVLVAPRLSLRRTGARLLCLRAEKAALALAKSHVQLFDLP